MASSNIKAVILGGLQQVWELLKITLLGEVI